MQTTPGITIPHITEDPLGTEGELTVGPDGVNPFNSPEEADIVAAYREGFNKPRFERVPIDDPTAGDDPFVFDDVGPKVDSLRLPTGQTGPRF